MSDYAYVWLLMLNRDYISGILTSMTSVRRSFELPNLGHIKNKTEPPTLNKLTKFIHNKGKEISYNGPKIDHDIKENDIEFVDLNANVNTSTTTTKPKTKSSNDKIYNEYKTCNPDLIVMVTPDITVEDRKILLQIADQVIEIDYIEKKSVKLGTKRQQELYDSWMNKSYTKMNCLKLIKYKKVLFLDADIIVVENINHLFELKTPAICTSTPFSFPFGSIPSLKIPISEIDNSGFIANNIKYGYRDHGIQISYQDMEYALNKHVNLLCGTSFLIGPDLSDFDLYIKILNEKNRHVMHMKDAYGNPSNPSGFDEQSIADLYIHKKQDFTNIHYKYNFISWKAGTLKEKPAIMHYFSDSKPWNATKFEWIDTKTWFQMTLYAISKYKIKEGYKPETLSIIKTMV